MNARGLLLLVVAVVLGLLALTGAPAPASAAQAPKVEEALVSSVASTSATFAAQVNPGGAETTYTFEYAPAGGGFKPVPEAEGSGSLPAGMAAVALSVHVQGLSPSTAYAFRVMAGNVVETVTGEAVAFQTQLAGGEFALPDGRQYEMVTPPQKEGALFEGLGPFTGPTGPVQASADGDAIVDVASQPTEAEPQGYQDLVSVLSWRGPGGWSSRDISPPREENGSYSPDESENFLFSEDLSKGLVQQFGLYEPLSPEASENTPYLQTIYFNGNPGERCEAPALSASSCFQPLVSRSDDTASPFEPFGGESGEPCVGRHCGPEFEDATPDFSHVIVKSGTPLASPRTGEGLYEWFGGELQLVSVLPDGEGTGAIVAGANYTLTSHEGPGVRRAISANGERVIFDAGGLYLRDVGRGETVPVSAVGRYMTASSDASKVFFVNGTNLEEFEVTSGEGEPLAGRVVDLTVDPHAGESAGVIQVLGASEDGSYVYFAASGALTANANPANECASLEEELRHIAKEKSGCNVYLYHDGVTSLVAAGWISDPRSEWSRVSPDGRWLAFMSARNLAGYDTRDALDGHADAEVYLYDASTGGLACASCDPTGERPVGVYDEGGSWTIGAWVAANVPGRARTFGRISSEAPPRYQPRYLSDSGRLFFETADALVPQDVNGVEDVYEYEPEGVPAGEHACGASSANGSEVYKPARAYEVGGLPGEEGAGCVALVSSGISGEPSSFVDASETGGDVFFLTTARLAPQDFDSAEDVYDAHECTSASPCVAPAVSPPACDTEASCRAAPVPQPAIYGAPSSATFSGSGNVVVSSTPPAVVKSAKKAVKKRCGRGRVRRTGRCVSARRSRRRTVRASRSSRRRARRSGPGHEGRSR